MTSHGFGGCRISSGRITANQIAEFAEKISRAKPIIKVHVVRGKTRRYNIIFEFDHLRKYKIGKRAMKPKDLLIKLQKIHIGGHGISGSTDFWIIQTSYQRGKLIKHA